MKAITKLTDKQIARFPEFVDKWTSIGLSCEPLDIEKAKAAVRKSYTAANVPPPKHFVCCDGPISATITAAILTGNASLASVRASVWDSVQASVWDSVQDSVLASVWDSVRASVQDSVRDSVQASVRDSVRASVQDSVRASVQDSVRDSVQDSVQDSVLASVLASVWASVWASVLASVRHQLFGPHTTWLSFYDFFRNACGLVDQCAPLDGLMELAQCCGWWAPYTDVAILQHRFCELHRDERGMLHNEHGMSVKYRDGWGLYSWHGTTVPAHVIEHSEAITPQQIREEENEEVRRVMIERMGWNKWLKAEKAKVVDTRFNERDGQHEKLYVLKDGTRRMSVRDPSTGREYSLGVPREVVNCEQGQAWLSHGLDRFVLHRS